MNTKLHAVTDANSRPIRFFMTAGQVSDYTGAADLAYVTKDQAETSVLFELISARYERRSILITANQPFGEWNRVFPDPAMTLAAVDRLVHHATIFEMNVESFRRRSAMEAKRTRGRPAAFATVNNTAQIVAERQSTPETELASDNHADTIPDTAT